MKALRTGLVLVVGIAAMSMQQVRADQPRMRETLQHLREARASLQAAEQNKGGHREKALQLIDQAIAEVEAGMHVAR